MLQTYKWTLDPQLLFHAFSKLNNYCAKHKKLVHCLWILVLMLHLHALLLHYTHVRKSIRSFAIQSGHFIYFIQHIQTQMYLTHLRRRASLLLLVRHHLACTYQVPDRKQPTPITNWTRIKDKYMLKDETLVLHINLIKRLSWIVCYYFIKSIELLSAT